MTHYFRIGNETVTAAKLNTLTPADVNKIHKDAARAEEMRQNNLADSMGLKRGSTMNLVPDVRPGSDLAKAILEDVKAKKESELVVSAVQPVNKEEKPVEKKKRGRPAKVKTEIVPPIE